MFSLLRRALLPAALSLACVVTAHAQTSDPNRLFADSRLIVRDRFSDEVVGKGPDVILIPGLSSSRETWKATAERLRDRYRLHLIQVAGFSGEPARANATGEVVVPTVEAIDAYLVEQKLAPAVIVGHSLGGTMTLYLAEHHPEHLRKAMLVDSLPFFGLTLGGPDATPASLRARAEATRTGMLADVGHPARAAQMTPQMRGMSKYEATRGRIAGWAVRTDPAVMAQALYDDTLLDLGPGLATLTTPITVLVPDYAPLGAAPGSTQKQYGAIYSAAHTVTVKEVSGSQHFAMFDAPEAFAADLDAFLSGR